MLYQSSCYSWYLCLSGCSSLHSHGPHGVIDSDRSDRIEPRSDFHLSRSSWHTLGASLWRRDSSAELKMGDIWPHRKMSILIFDTTIWWLRMRCWGALFSDNPSCGISIFQSLKLSGFLGQRWFQKCKSSISMTISWAWGCFQIQMQTNGCFPTAMDLKLT